MLLLLLLLSPPTGHLRLTQRCTARDEAALGVASPPPAAAAAAADAAAADAAAPPAADEGDAPSNAALSLACIGCFRLPSDMDDGREKHPICDMCRDEKLPTTRTNAARTARRTLALGICTGCSTRS